MTSGWFERDDIDVVVVLRLAFSTDFLSPTYSARPCPMNRTRELLSAHAFPRVWLV